MIYGYARVSTDGQSVAAQVAALRKHGAGKVLREVASGDMPKFRNLWEHLRGSDLPKKGRRKSGKLDPLKIPALL